jgi:serine/threonine-protein kinase
MGCPDDDVINALLEGTLRGEELARVSAHLQRCSECQQLLAALGAPPPGSPAGPEGRVLPGGLQLLHLLGEGGMGRVHAAFDPRLGQRVAVKILRPELRHQQQSLERFRHEAHISGMLGNPHVVRLHELAQLDDGTPYLVMELLQGEDLAQRLALDGPLPPPLAVSVLQQICSALEAAHGEGVVHRDLKPSNVFLCAPAARPTVKVLDFGLSKARGLLATLTRSQEVLGTPCYMSPEMAAGRQHQVDARSDLFSLGTLAYEALTGRRAFDARTIPQMVHQVRHADPPPPHELRASIPRDLSDVVTWLLRKDPQQRPQSARQVRGLLGLLQP